MSRVVLPPLMVTTLTFYAGEISSCMEIFLFQKMGLVQLVAQVEFVAFVDFFVATLVKILKQSSHRTLLCITIF